ncbi:MAG: hypothetical protein LBT80_01140 [Lactobacillaceae bacterium]|jgi:4-amino-4-deoxy-L-arabinose transferase-like glycosyltransferase|nr:hypothetical protein [Lactobacillaceae bacterium]
MFREPIKGIFKLIGIIFIGIFAIIVLLPLALTILGFALKTIFVAIGVIAIFILVVILLIAVVGLIFVGRYRKQWREAEEKGTPYDFGGKHFKMHVDGQDTYYDNGRKDVTPPDDK